MLTIQGEVDGVGGLAVEGAEFHQVFFVQDAAAHVHGQDKDEIHRRRRGQIFLETERLAPVHFDRQREGRYIAQVVDAGEHRRKDEVGHDHRGRQHRDERRVLERAIDQRHHQVLCLEKQVVTATTQHT